MKSTILVTGALTNALLGLCSQAVASSLPFPYNVPFEQIEICLNGVPCQFGGPPSFSVFGGTGTINLNPSPNLRASASVTGVNQQLSTSVFLTYYFEVSGATNQPLDVIISASASESPPKTGAGFANSATLKFGVPNLPTTIIARACAPGISGCPASSFSIAQVETVTTNTVYEIDMLLGAAATTFPGGTTDSATASMDPIVSFRDPTNASQFQLLFSDGIGNSSAATPLPAAFPLFVSGVGVLGFLGWRRKRKQAA